MNAFQMHHEIISRTSSYNRTYRTTSENFQIHIYYDEQENVTDLKNILEEINKTLNEIFTQTLNEIDDNDDMRVSLRNVDLENEIYTIFRKKKDFTIDLIMNEIVKISQSKKEFLLNGLIELNVISVKVPPIGGPKYTTFIDIDKWRRNSNKVVRVKADGLCLARAIVVSVAHSDGIRGLEWRRIREDVKKIQTIKALDLCSLANININSKGFEYSDFPKFQLALIEHQLIVVSPPKIFLFKGDFKEKQIYVQVIQSHADSLLSIKSFLRCNYFCKKCLIGYMNLTSHRCHNICKYCFAKDVCDPVQNIDCNKCNRYFVSEICFQHHLQNKICNNYKYCIQCKKLYSNKNHQCNMKKCTTCRKLVPISHHNCYMKPNNKEDILNEDSIPKIFIFYDFESFIEVNENGEKIHKPNLCCMSVVCDYCWDN